MKSQRNFSRTEAKRVGNVTIILAIFLSLCVLSIIKSHFAPYVKSDEPVVFEEERKESLKIEKEETKETAETADSAAIEDEDDEAETETKAEAEAVDLSKPTCYESSRRSDTCEAAGDVRVQGRTQTVYIQPLAQSGRSSPTAGSTTPSRSPTSRIPRQQPQALVDQQVPAHLPAALQVRHNRRRQRRRGPLLPARRRRPDLPQGARRRRGRTAGGYSAVDFRKLLRRAFGLERAAAAPSGDQWDIRRRPRLLIISRKNSRTFLNERAMVDMATSLGFDVRVGEPDINTDVAKFARLVNSADVMVGAHGAGLTNMVFLPAGAVLIQIVPFGGLEWLARGTFQEPAKDMEIHYIEYKIQLDETTLSEQYHNDHPVLKDPFSVHKQGWTRSKPCIWTSRI
uniref:Glycosyltransferase 61 catalytic domain-containing protein n=1 Tax=Ananas comosus var. bracteatus TaxID=296719 RepID=A0A6V7Q5W1_ANACO|nr:unnamed protein product [Ananas comosus var. bracteatus]